MLKIKNLVTRVLVRTRGVLYCSTGWNRLKVWNRFFFFILLCPQWWLTGWLFFFILLLLLFEISFMWGSEFVFTQRWITERESSSDSRLHDGHFLTSVYTHGIIGNKNLAEQICCWVKRRETELSCSLHYWWLQVQVGRVGSWERSQSRSTASVRAACQIWAAA